MEVIFILFIGVVLTALIGHGIWVVAAWLLRGCRSRVDRYRYEPTLEDDRAATARYLEHQRSRGLIDAETHTRLMGLIARDAQPIPWAREYVNREDTAPRIRAAHADTAHPPRRTVAHVEGQVDEELLEGLSRGAPAVDEGAAPPAAEPAAARVGESTSLKSIQPEPEPLPPRRPFSEVLVSFMAEKNIRWGELIGGLLIVGCSVALVISLWSQIASIPVLKFLIFTAVTAALFGAGLFVQHRWKLPTTGRALLLIASLLVPLNFLAFAAFSMMPSAGGGGGTGALAIEAGSVMLFAFLTFLAGRIVLAEAPLLFAVGVVILSAPALGIRHALTLGQSGLWGMASALIGIYLLVMAAPLLRASRRKSLDEPQVRSLLLQLGVMSYACLVPLGLLLYETGQAVGALQSLAPLLCAYAVPALVVGLFVWRRAAGPVAASLRTFALSVALMAAAIMLAGIVLSWPTPSRLLPALLVNALAMIGLGNLTRHAAIQATAVVWLAAVWVLGVQLISGSLAWSSTESAAFVAALLSARTGQALVAVVVACLLLAAWLHQQHKTVLARAYLIVSAAFLLISTALVTIYGFGVRGDPQHITWVYGLYSLAAFTVAWRARHSAATWVGAILGQMAVVELLVYVWPLRESPWPTALLIGASACTAAAAILYLLRSRPASAAQVFITPLAAFAVIVSLPTAAWMAYSLTAETLTAAALRTAWLSGLWLILAFVSRQPILLAGSQIAAVAAAGAAVQHYLFARPWYPQEGSPLHDPRVWQAHLLAAGALCLIWAIVRWVVDWRCERAEKRTYATAAISSNESEFDSKPASGRPHGLKAVAHLHEHSYADQCESPAVIASELLNPVFPAVDHWLTGAVVLGLAFLSVWAVAPGVVMEHGSTTTPPASDLHHHAAEVASWGLWAIVAAALAVRLGGGGLYGLPLPALLVVVASGIGLTAARLEAQHHVVSLLRWLLATAFLVGAAASWLCAFRLDRSKRVSAVAGAEAPPPVFTWPKPALFYLFGLPAVLLTVTFAVAIGQGSALVPATASAMDLRFVLLGPVGLVIVSLFGWGVTERRPGHAVDSAVLASAAVTITELSLLTRSGSGISSAFAAWLVQLNVIVTSAIAVVWGLAQTLLERQDARLRMPTWPFAVGRVAIGAVLLAAIVALWIQPAPVLAIVGQAGTVWGVFAVLLVEGALLMSDPLAWPARVWSRLGLWGLLAVVLLASILVPFDVANWLCFHTMLVGFVIAGWLRLIGGTRHVRSLVGAGWSETFETAAMQTRSDVAEIGHDVSCSNCGYNLRGLAPSGRCPECNGVVADSLGAAVSRLTPAWWAEQVGTRARTAAMVLACVGLGTLLAIRGVFGDPDSPWWSVGAMATAGLLCLVLGGWAPRRVYAYVGGLEIGLAASVWWGVRHWQGGAAFAGDLSSIININVMALALTGVAWLFVERWMILPRVAEGSAGRWPAFHHAAALISTVVVSTMAGLELYGHAWGQPFASVGLANWLAWGAAVMLMAACCLRPALRFAAGGLYVLGLAGIALATSQARLAPPALPWVLSLSLAGYALFTMLVWRLVSAIRPAAASSDIAMSLSALNGCCSLIAVGLGVYVNFANPDLNLRLLIAASPLLCAAAMAASVKHLPGLAARAGCLAFLAGAGVLFAWAWVTPGLGAVLLLERAIGLVAVVAATTIALSIASSRTTGEGPWRTTISWDFTTFGAVGTAVLLFAAGYEVLTLVGHQAPAVPAFAIGTLIAALSLLVAWCILLATSDRFDPLRLDETAKEAYTYLAEGLAAGLALHVRATMPWLFTGFITQHWPILVMVLASVAVGAGEICARHALRTLARPLQRSGLFLPVLVLPELFLASSEVHYSIVLLVAGVLYAVLAGLRRSFLLGLISGAAITGSLWYLLYHTPGLSLAMHPQLWLVPPALAVLFAGHLNRAQLGEQQRRALNYGCLLAIYLSSTADIFLVGVAQAPWLPLVLAGLSVTGILVGIGTRIRSFLILGTGFLCLSLLTMIWHAAANLGWTWVWYVAGIALGVGIITLFALFEKRRREMTALVEEVKRWSD